MFPNLPRLETFARGAVLVGTSHQRSARENAVTSAELGADIAVTEDVPEAQHVPQAQHAPEAEDVPAPKRKAIERGQPLVWRIMLRSR